MSHLLLLMAGMGGADVQAATPRAHTVIVTPPRPVWILWGMQPVQTHVTRWRSFPGQIRYRPAAVMSPTRKPDLKPSEPRSSKQAQADYPYRSRTDRRWWEYPAEKPAATPPAPQAPPAPPKS